MRDGVFEIPLKLFVGALDQQLRLVRLANEWREVSQREPGNQLLPSRPDQQVDGLTSHFDKRPPREIRRNGSIELSLESNQRQGMPLPEAHGGVGVEIEDNVENRLRIAVEHRRREFDNPAPRPPVRREDGRGKPTEIASSGRADDRLPVRASRPAGTRHKTKATESSRSASRWALGSLRPRVSRSPQPLASTFPAREH